MQLFESGNILLIFLHCKLFYCVIAEILILHSHHFHVNLVFSVNNFYSLI